MFSKQPDPKPRFYAGPYVPSGVLYYSGGVQCRWLVPGFNPNPPIHMIDVYSKDPRYS